MELLPGKHKGAQEPMLVSTKQQRIAELAALHPRVSFTSLNHHIDEQWLHEAYRRTRKDGAAGVDGTTAREYEQNLSGNLRDLLARFKSGRYKAPPVRRVYIPKGNGELRPLGIPTLEDKILQRAVVMLMEPIYENDFLDCSYGFRPKRSAHQAIQSIWKTCMDVRGGYVLDVDVRKFFDTLDHTWLRKMLKHRINDGVILRTINKWLKAGVMDMGILTRPTAGSPQGGVISPLLSNIYLHYVLDLWVEKVVQSRLVGRIQLVRFADDFVMIFSHQADAQAVHEALPHRFGKFGLYLHPDKTRLVRFIRPTRTSTAKPETFNFLGFTLYWGLSRKGYPVVKRKTASDRFARSLKAIWRWCKRYRHSPVKVQYRTLRQKLLGHYGYYGVTHNMPALKRFLNVVKRHWYYWLNRRNRERCLSWEAFNHMLTAYPLPEPRIVHSYAQR